MKMLRVFILALLCSVVQGAWAQFGGGDGSAASQQPRGYTYMTDVKYNDYPQLADQKFGRFPGYAYLCT